MGFDFWRLLETWGGSKLLEDLFSAAVNVGKRAEGEERMGFER